MQQEAFLGIFGVREPDFIASMPVEHAVGLWQAWELPDGDYIVQPVDEQFTPLGDSYLLDRMSFIALLAPVAIREEEDAPPGRNAAPAADSPGLLEYWYRQETPETRPLATESRTESAGPAGTDEDMESLLDDALAETPVAVDERMFAPLWHPDEAWPERDEAETPRTEYVLESFPLAPASRSKKKPMPFISVLFGTKGNAAPSDGVYTLQRTDPAPERLAGRENLRPASMTAAGPGPKEAHPACTAELVGDMKKEFEQLLEEAGDVPQPSLEQKFIDIIGRKGSFGEEHKYLFSEFGLALRRKRKHHLALAAHKRALDLAPRDEHVLFNIARTEYELGNIEHARQCLEQALALSPAFSSAITFLAFLNGTSDDRENHP